MVFSKISLVVWDFVDCSWLYLYFAVQYLQT
jgi:hypothetical protein